MDSVTSRKVIVAGALMGMGALALGSIGGTAYGDHAARRAIAALPTQTPVVVIRTRTVTKIVTRTLTRTVVHTRIVPHIVVHTKTVTRVVVVTPTPLATATPVPPTATPPTDGPQHPLSGATYCTDDHLCVTLTGYTLDQSGGGDGEKALLVWFHVANGGSKDNNVGINQFAAGIPGGQVLDAEYICGDPCVTNHLVAGGALNGSVTFDVPATSHAANIRFTSGWSFGDQGPYGAWDVSY